MTSETITTQTVTTVETPLITINQISLSGKQLWAIAVTIFGLLGSGFASGYIFKPAKAEDLSALSAVVMAIQTQHAETRTQMATLAVQTTKLGDAVEGLTVTMEAMRAAIEKRAAPTPPARRTGMKKPAGPGEAKRAAVAATVQR